MRITPVILSGGSGKRLWPLSRQTHPKQYLSLTSNKTMLQETILRLSEFENLTDPVIICNSENRFLVAEQCQQINLLKPTIMLEPIGRNTAPAIAAVAIQAIKNFEDTVLLVLPADHSIEDIDEFHLKIKVAIKEAELGSIATFGIVPTDLKNGYGYIKLAKEIHNGVYKVDKFIEKPDLKTAEIFLKKGKYLWNSGMFVFKASALIEELNIFAPMIIKAVNLAVENATHDLDFIRLDKKAFESSPSDSIDYALMEKSQNIVVIPMDAKWNDLGSWTSLYNIGEKDENKNVIRGDVFASDTFNTYISANHHLIVTLGIENLIVVGTEDVTFIASHDKSEEVGKVVESMELKERKEVVSHRKIYRPWGWYDSIDSGQNFQVKRLYIKPGAKLSLQMHEKRAEHWVVITGVASVINGEKNITLKKGESTYIPIGIKHSLENKATEPLEIIEVQGGVYLGEDDIVRFEDIYGRLLN